MSAALGRADARRFAGRLLICLITTLMFDYLCTWLARANSGVALLWLPDALLLGLQMGDDARRRRYYVAVRIGAGFVAHVLYGDALTLSFVLAMGGGLQLGLAATWLDGRADSWRRLAEPAALRRLLIHGVILSPLIGGAAIAVMLLILIPDMHLRSALALWRNWALASATGVAIVTPLVLALRDAEWQERILGDGGRANIAIQAGAIAMIAAVLSQASYPLLFLPVPMMLLVATRTGLFGAALMISAAGALAGLFTVLGIGPLAAGGFSPLERALLVQAFVATAMAITIPIAIVAAARRRADHALLENSTRLARSEYLFRLLAEHSSDAVMRTGIDGRRRYISPSIFRIAGYTPAEMTAPDWVDPVHPDDLPAVRRSREILAMGENPPPNLFRYLHRDGAYLWFESRITLVRGPSGAPEEFISNIRDITAQKLAEDALASANASLLELSETDGLTGIANRRRFDAGLFAELHRAARAGTPTALLMLDADHFKAYNDRLGHQAGDECLRVLAQTIATPVRNPTDLVARYGGEEFAIILPDTSIVAAGMIAERLRLAVLARAIPHPDNPGGLVTVSIGVACHNRGNGTTPARLIEAADAALYAAKRAGRNRVAGAPPDHLALAAD